MNIKGFQIEMDAKAAISLVTGNASDVHEFSNLIRDCIIACRGQVQTIDHVYREGNLSADAIASLNAAMKRKTFTVFVILPSSY